MGHRWQIVAYVLSGWTFLSVPIALAVGRRMRRMSQAAELVAETAPDAKDPADKGMG